MQKAQLDYYAVRRVLQVYLSKIYMQLSLFSKILLQNCLLLYYACIHKVQVNSYSTIAQKLPQNACLFKKGTEHKALFINQAQNGT